MSALDLRTIFEGAPARPLFARCVYCGHWSRGRTCPAHRDLPQLEYLHQSPPHHREMEGATGSYTGG